FDEALPTFADGTVGLLHIDGYHTYDAVKHDFEAWRPKLTADGVVVLHDTNVRDPGFGVRRFWGEIKEHYRCFEFQHGQGLGVRGRGGGGGGGGGGVAGGGAGGGGPRPPVLRAAGPSALAPGRPGCRRAAPRGDAARIGRARPRRVERGERAPGVLGRRGD